MVFVYLDHTTRTRVSPSLPLLAKGERLARKRNCAIVRWLINQAQMIYYIKGNGQGYDAHSGNLGEWNRSTYE